ncbi:Protein CBG27798 [Caenorhabditis briggsae]|uniref:Protein CBG27798 n=1 Tax=Caenorhabditis briggsae TaxID=6238 RepID=B6II35_CAEBR|nr:Protein CBG27798 [Caenorhabditis briggsae]CAR99565.1 Protein CBG27798 [Caenorhabditis briggsae]
MLLSIIGILAVMGCFLFLASYQKIGTMLFLRINNVVAVLCFLLYSATILTLLILDAKGIFLDSGILLCHDLQSETYRNILLYTAGKYYLIIGLYLNEYPIREGFFTICEVVCHILFRGNHPQTNFNRIVTRLGGATVIRSRRPNNAPSRRVSSVLPLPYQTIEETTAIISNRPARRTTSGPPPVYQASSDTTTTHNSGLSAESRPLRDNEAPPSYMVE